MQEDHFKKLKGETSFPVVVLCIKLANKSFAYRNGSVHFIAFFVTGDFINITYTKLHDNM